MMNRKQLGNPMAKGLALGLASTFVVPTPSTQPVGTVGALRGVGHHGTMHNL